ncbi:hypothetical protein ACFWAF_14900 [Streptomyces microflavus]|uniref:hypothetical protein n=1 Tax=Streptomyces microflavus TaxID=1919 RepID=UPI0036630B17
MSAPKDDDERRLRSRIRRLVDGPPPEPEELSPLVQVRYVPPPATASPPVRTDDQEPEPDEDDVEPDAKRPWWQMPPGPFSSGAPAPEPAPAEQEMAPGLYVTVAQPQATPPPWLAPNPAAERAAERLHRRRIWLAYHAGAAGVGWFCGLVGLMRDLLADAGPAAPGVGIAMGLVTYIVASYLPGLPYMPPALRPVMVWAARIPVCSAALALALHAPGTL